MDDERLQRAVNALSNLTEAWAHLRLDTPEDQALHDRLVEQSRRAIAAIRRLT